MGGRFLYAQGPHEIYANAFAMHLLMPTPLVEAMDKLRYTTEQMAAKFGVDVEVMALRRQMLAEDQRTPAKLIPIDGGKARG